MIECIFWICLMFVACGLFGLLGIVIEKIDEKQCEKELAEKIKAEKIKERTRI